MREWWFELMFPFKLDQAEKEWRESQPPSVAPPVITHHEIDDELQTGESRKLGGALEIKAPWHTDNDQ